MSSLLLNQTLSNLGLFFDRTTQHEAIEIPFENTFQICTNVEEFHHLASEWNPLLQDSAANSIFLTWEWVSTWWEYFSTNKNLWVVAIRNRNGELVGLAPLAIKKNKSVTGLNLRELVFLGHGAAAPDHLDFIIRHGHEKTVTKLLLSLFRKESSQWDQICFQGLVADPHVISTILSEQTFPHVIVEQHTCPHLPLPDNWDDLRNNLSSSMRYKLGRFERRIKKDYPLITSFKLADDVDKFMPILFELHMLAQKRKNNIGLFSDETMRNFHTRIAQNFIEKDWLRSYTLDVGNNSIAALHCFQYDGTVSFYQSGFDLFWKKYSPGSLIMTHAIKQAIQEKNTAFDFLRGDEEYKYNWTKEEQTNLTISIPVSFHGKIRTQIKEYSKKIKSFL